jgi:hypothetical protein
MLYAAHQPHYLPWLRYLHKVAAVDVFVLLDDAQYTKNGWQNRTRIKGPEGPILLTVPVQARLGARIRMVPPVGDQWVRRHLASLETCYGRPARTWMARLAAVLAAGWSESLALLDQATLAVLLDAFGIATPVVRASELGVDGRGSERLAAIGTALGADAYVTGAHAVEAYLDTRPFIAAGIEVAVQAWTCPSYRQRFPRAGFVPELSAVDLLANEPDRALGVLMSGGRINRDPALAAHAGA